MNKNIDYDTNFSRENHFDIGLVLVLFVTALVLSITFFRPNYFGGDVWFKFHHLSSNSFDHVFEYIFFTTSNKHFNPLNRILLLAKLRLFGLHHAPFYLLNIIIHLTVTGCFYKFLKFHIDNKIAVLFLTLFFSINAAYYPGGLGAGWVMGGQSIMLAQLFLLLALLSLTRFQIYGKKRILVFTGLFTILSVFSCDTGLLTPTVLILYWLLVPITWRQKEKVTNNWWIVLITIFILWGVTNVVYLFVPSMNGILTRAMPTTNTFLIYNVALSIFSGISAFVFFAFGGKLFIEPFNLDPRALLSPFLLSHSTLITGIFLGLIFVSLFLLILIYIYHNRKGFFHTINEYSGLLLFALFYIIAAYTIKALGRIYEFNIVDFMVPDHYRYEPFLVLALFLLPILHFLIESLKPITSKTFRQILLPLSIFLLVFANIPVLWAKGSEFPQDIDFLNSYRQLLKTGTNKKPLYLWDINYTFHDHISSSFPLSSIARMDNSNMDSVWFIAHLQNETTINKDSLIFYYIFSPDLRSEIRNKIISEQ